MEKMTKKEYFGEIKKIVEGANVDNRDEIIEFIDRQVELLSKKSNAKTKVQKENEVLVEGVYAPNATCPAIIAPAATRLAPPVRGAVTTLSAPRATEPTVFASVPNASALATDSDSDVPSEKLVPLDVPLFLA